LRTIVVVVVVAVAVGTDLGVVVQQVDLWCLLVGLHADH
jgi:hypothetical protein